MLVELLNEEELTTATARDGAEALAIVEALQPDLILLDARMPVLDGFATCERLRAMPESATIPILMITALQNDESVEQAFAAGADDVLPKPLNLTLLVQRVHHLLRVQQQARALQANEARYRLIVETAHEGIWVLDPVGQTVYANERMAEWLGLSVEALRGQPIQAFVEEGAEALLLQRGERGSVQSELSIKRADGGRCWVLATSSPLSSDAGHPLGTLLMVTDIQARKEAEEQLRESERFLREAQRAARLGGWFRRLGSDTVTLTGEIQNIYGFPPETSEVAFAQIQERVHPDDRAHVSAALAQAIEEKGSVAIRYRIVRPDGDERVLSGHGAYVENERGPFLVGSTRDITAEVRSEEALHLRDQAIAATTSGILLTDANQPDNPIIFANPAFTSLTGYDAQEVLGRNCRFLQGAETEQATVEQLGTAIRRGQSITVEILNYRKDGTPFWNYLAISPIHDAHGQVTHFIGIQQDVTARRLFEEEVLRSEQRFAAIFHASPVGIAISSLTHGYAMDVNQSFLDIFGKRREEVVGQTTAQMQLWAQPDTRERILGQLAAQGWIRNMELQARHEDGTLCDVLYSAEQITLAGEACVLSYVRDITERKQAEDALLHINRQLTETLESTTDAFCAIDREGRIVHLNGRAEMLLERPREELLGSNVWQRFP